VKTRLVVSAVFSICSLGLALPPGHAAPPAPLGAGPVSKRAGQAKRAATAPAKRAPITAWRVDLSGSWSDADGKRAAKTLAQKLASSPWVRAFAKQHRRPPRLRLLAVRNRTSQMLNTRQFERELAKSLQPHRRLRLLPGKTTKKRKRPRPADLKLTLWVFGHRDARGGTTVTNTLLSLVGALPSGEQVVGALYEQRKLVIRPQHHAKSGAPRPTVRHVPLNMPLDLSGHFNDYDARQLSRGALRSLSASPWLAKASRTAQATTKPLVRLAPLRNRTAKHLPLAMLRHRLAAGLLASGKVRLLGTSSGSADAVISGHVTSIASRVHNAGKTRQQVRRYMLALRATAPSGLVRWVHTGSVKKVIVLPPTSGGSQTKPSSGP
jgi:hypothetical protein